MRSIEFIPFYPNAILLLYSLAIQWQNVKLFVMSLCFVLQRKLFNTST